MKNAYAAYEEISDINPYSISKLKRVHGIMTKYIVDESGIFRHGESVFIYPFAEGKNSIGQKNIKLKVSSVFEIKKLDAFLIINFVKI